MIALGGMIGDKQCRLPALPLDELGGCLGAGPKVANKTPKMQLCSVVQRVTNVHQAKGNENDEGEWNTFSCTL